MGRKQLKIALSEDFYLELDRAARKHKIPVSTFARSLIAAGLKQRGGIKSSIPVTSNVLSPSTDEFKNENLITLSEILADDPKSNLAATKPASKLISPENKTPVSIQIIFNN